MTTTVTLANMPSAPTDVAVKFLDQSLLKRRSFTVTKDGITAEYVYISGDPTLETSVLVTTQVNEKSNTLRSSISLRTIQVVSVDDVVKESAPIVVSMIWTTPGPAEDVAKVLAMIGTCYSLAFNGVTSKVPNEGIVGALNRGLADNLYS